MLEKFRKNNSTTKKKRKKSKIDHRREKEEEEVPVRRVKEQKGNFEVLPRKLGPTEL